MSPYSTDPPEVVGGTVIPEAPDPPSAAEDSVGDGEAAAVEEEIGVDMVGTGAGHAITVASPVTWPGSVHVEAAAGVPVVITAAM